MSKVRRNLLIMGSFIFSAALISGQGCPGLAGRNTGEGLGRGFPTTCPSEDPAAAIDVAGVFRYAGDRLGRLTGTITFEQEGNLVRVTDTTYDFSHDRRLQGEATLQGNGLTIQLLPKNGDTDYRANVVFLFNNDGSEFCVAFADTNGDGGGLGIYRGWRISR